MNYTNVRRMDFLRLTKGTKSILVFVQNSYKSVNHEISIVVSKSMQHFGTIYFPDTRDFPCKCIVETDEAHLFGYVVDFAKDIALKEFLNSCCCMIDKEYLKWDALLDTYVWDFNTWAIPQNQIKHFPQITNKSKWQDWANCNIVKFKTRSWQEYLIKRIK
jgi:S-adenosylmethionine:tRNA-ribosyltransferase-isomerase (queuine synthetase)